ncbi:hypothetical protein KCU79_g69, partial [Aureobasidium melanogenum]
MWLSSRLSILAVSLVSLTSSSSSEAMSAGEVIMRRVQSGRGTGEKRVRVGKRFGKERCGTVVIVDIMVASAKPYDSLTIRPFHDSLTCTMFHPFWKRVLHSRIAPSRVFTTTSKSAHPVEMSARNDMLLSHLHVGAAHIPDNALCSIHAHIKRPMSPQLQQGFASDIAEAASDGVSIFVRGSAVGAVAKGNLINVQGETTTSSSSSEKASSGRYNNSTASSSHGRKLISSRSWRGQLPSHTAKMNEQIRKPSVPDPSTLKRTQVIVDTINDDSEIPLSLIRIHSVVRNLKLSIVNVVDVVVRSNDHTCHVGFTPLDDETKASIKGSDSGIQLTASDGVPSSTALAVQPAGKRRLQSFLVNPNGQPKNQSSGTPAPPHKRQLKIWRSPQHILECLESLFLGGVVGVLWIDVELEILSNAAHRWLYARLETLNGQGKKEQSFVLLHSTFYTALSARSDVIPVSVSGLAVALVSRALMGDKVSPYGMLAQRDWQSARRDAVASCQHAR